MPENQINSVSRYRDEVPDGAVGMYDVLISENCRPSIAAASATYLFGLLSGNKVSQAVLAEHFETTVASISKWYQYLCEDTEEWKDIGRPYDDCKLLEQLPRQKEADKNATVETLLEDIRALGGIDHDNHSKQSLTSSDIEELTGKADVLQQMDALEEDFNLNFGGGNDGTVQLIVNKSGLEKIRDEMFTASVSESN